MQEKVVLLIASQINTQKELTTSMWKCAKRVIFKSIYYILTYYFWWKVGNNSVVVLAFNWNYEDVYSFMFE